jgi:hypothetical protein
VATRSRHFRLYGWFLVAGLWTRAGAAHEPPKGSEREGKGADPKAHEPEVEVTITGERPDGETASRRHVTRRELELRPKHRPGDIFEA